MLDMVDGLDLTPEQKAAFYDHFMGEYLRDGYGYLGKRQVELKIYAALVAAKPEIRGAGVQPGEAVARLADALGQTPAYVKKLMDDHDRADRELDEAAMKRELRGLLLLANPDLEKGRLQIEIYRRKLKDYAEQVIRAGGFAPDTSFNRSILSLSPSAFCYIVLQTLGEKDARAVEAYLVGQGVIERAPVGEGGRVWKSVARAMGAAFEKKASEFAAEELITFFRNILGPFGGDPDSPELSSLAA